MSSSSLSSTSVAAARDAFAKASAGAREGDIGASLTLARTLLERGSFVVRGGTHQQEERFCFSELEVYAHISNATSTRQHFDPFAHCDARQLYGGALYFHRVGTGDDAYKGGSYKGLDVTAGGGGECFVGILVRAIQRSDNGSIVEGPSLVVDTLLQGAGAESIKAYVDSLQSHQLLDPKVPSACAEDAPISIHLQDGGEVAQGVICTSARIGLSLKKVKSAEASHFDYVLSPYRLVRQPELHPKGRPHVVCALLVQDGGGADGEPDVVPISAQSGAKVSIISKYAADMKAGKKKAAASPMACREPFLGTTLNTQKLCELHGILYNELKKKAQSTPTSTTTTTTEAAEKKSNEDDTCMMEVEEEEAEEEEEEVANSSKKKRKKKTTTPVLHDSHDEGQKMPANDEQDEEEEDDAAPKKKTKKTKKESTPDEALSKPDEIMSTPDETTSKPDETMSKPDETMSKPDETMSKPDEAMSKPDEAMSKPDEIMSKQPDEAVSTTFASSISSASSASEAFAIASEGARNGDVSAALQLAKTLLERGSFVVQHTWKKTVQRFRFSELEVYANIQHSVKSHLDPFTHCDPRQAYGGALYFHRMGPGEDAYRYGSYKGVDVTAGTGGGGGGSAPKCYVGILVRGLEKEADQSVVDGPSLVVDTLLEAVGSRSIKSYVDRLSASGGETKLLAPKVPSACATDAPIHVELSETAAEEDDIVSSARVGLSLRKVKQTSETHFDYLLRPYRLVRRPQVHSKGRPHVVCSLLVQQQQYDHADICKLSGAKPSIVQKYAADLESGKKKVTASNAAAAREPFLGTTLNTQKLCELHGILSQSLQDYYASVGSQPKPETAASASAANLKEEDDGGLVDSDADEEEAPPTKKLKKKTKTSLPPFPESEDEEESEGPVPTKEGTTTQKTAAAKWQYYLSNSVDGKKIGWYNYDATASAKLETKWNEQAHLGVMNRTTWHLKSGYFNYEVNLGTMTQRNMSSGTVRHIRRVEAGAKVTNEAPSTSPAGLSGGDDDDNNEEDDNPTKQGSASATDDGSDPLKLKPLFKGQHGSAWEGPLMEVLSAAGTKAASYIGPNRDKAIMPVRELTFQALKPNPPAAWRVVTFGQSPYPRIESATGIAHFDNQIDSWESKAFGKAASMRCIIKAAAMHKHGVGIETTVAVLRKMLTGDWNAVTPPQWFEAMLTQGVLLLNAALTLGGSGLSKDNHVSFWKPIVTRIVREILQAKVGLPVGHAHRGVLMLWWGNDSLKVKKSLQPVFAEFADKVPIHHIQHTNPAAQGELFCKGDENHFTKVNNALTANGQQPIDWLPTKDWLAANVMSAHSAFISETQDLHKMYLERLQDGLQTVAEMKPIQGVMKSELCALPEAVNPLGGGLTKVATSAVKIASKMAPDLTLNDNEKGAIYLYTGNSLYSKLNAALRDPNRSLAEPYFRYLRIFIEAYEKMRNPKNEDIFLYRGIRKDLTSEYVEGSVATWWSVSSCTPNINVAKQFGGGAVGGTLFEVKAKTAVPIMNLSAYQGEEEYILSPGTKLKVVSVTKKAGQASKICLEEIPDERLVS